MHTVKGTETPQRYDRWRMTAPSRLYAYSGNAYGIQANQNPDRYRLDMDRAMIAWEAAIASGFVCC